jgi:putative FmdB family regulatory protein
MPIYEYECTKCGKQEEVLQHFSDKPLTKCRSCAGKLQKLISQTTFHLKGTGWYVTDYANKSASTPKPSSKDAKSKDAKSKSADTTASDTGSDSKKKSSAEST